MRPEKRRVRVLMVTRIAPPHHSGAGKQAALLAAALSRHGHDVRIFTGAFGVRGVQGADAVPTMRWPVPRRSDRAEKLVFLAGLALQLSRRRHDVVHVHGAVFVLRLLRILKPALGFRVVYKATTAGLDDAARVAELRGPPTVDAVDAWACIAEPLADAAEAVGVPCERIARIPNAVELQRFAPDARARARVRRRLGLEDVTWVTIGRVGRRKAQALLVEAWALLPPPRPTLLIVGPVGDGALGGNAEYARRLRGRIEELQLGGSVRLLGERDDVADLLSAADGFVFASQREGLPTAVLEALASGLPVVSTVFEAAADVRTLGGGRVAFVPAEPAAIAAAVRDAPLERSRPEGLAAVDVDSIAARYEALYTRLLPSSSPRSSRSHAATTRSQE